MFGSVLAGCHGVVCSAGLERCEPALFDRISFFGGRELAVPRNSAPTFPVLSPLRQCDCSAAWISQTPSSVPDLLSPIESWRLSFPFLRGRGAVAVVDLGDNLLMVFNFFQRAQID
jgi:hypothetical protein